ncbi:MAG TPA: polyphosphate kinase 1 [Solirubrobacteraceae bacterium]|nr:polyphosphate kinase 1 [Solirubrobacteraceae bacterium]
MTTPDTDITLQDPIGRIEPTPGPAPAADLDLHATSLYFGRELSWLDFNDRVLQLVEDDEMPLLERVKLAAIWSSNNDEFFQIRVAGVHDQIDAGLSDTGPDGLTPTKTIDAIRDRVLGQQQRLEEAVLGELVPALRENGIRILALDDLSKSQRKALAKRFRRQIFPVLTPLAVGQGRPFPYISSLSLSLAALVRDPVSDEETFARIKVPTEMLDRFVEVDDEPNAFVALEEVIAANLRALFPGMEVVSHGFFRVTRDADFEVSDEADDLLQAVEAELRRRRMGEAVRLEVDVNIDSGVRDLLRNALDLEERQVYDVDGILGLADLWQIYGVRGFSELRDPPWNPVTQPRLQGNDNEPANVLTEMRRGDIFVHHPYDSFATSVERFVEQAVSDPEVLAIKQTVYRTSDDSRLVQALIRATEAGKQAVCMVELKARFDERANISWARSLEQAGVHVVYGYPGLKTHAKCILVVRREGDGVRHYVHIGTGNYHPKTAHVYTDVGLFTCDEDIGNDVADMFNFLTGLGRPSEYRKALIAPRGMREGILEEIDRTIAAHERGEKAQIRLKMNSLVDRRCIRALYRASQAGVPVQLNVRGICCLRPGVPGTSENITVTSVLGRFLEHSRIYAFDYDGQTRVLIGSADLMPRNLDTRVELITPVEDATAKADLIDALERSLETNVWTWELCADGSWAKRDPGQQPRQVQRELMLLHAARASEGSQADTE